MLWRCQAWALPSSTATSAPLLVPWPNLCSPKRSRLKSAERGGPTVSYGWAQLNSEEITIWRFKSLEGKIDGQLTGIYIYGLGHRFIYRETPTYHNMQLVGLGDTRILIEGRFTPRGRVNLLCKRLEILTCDWPKGSNRSQRLYI
jgi:hypothetical protein